MLPFDFVVVGIPKSIQSKGRLSRRNLRKWQDKVRQTALAQWPAGTAPISQELTAFICYYHTGSTPIDVDNIVKPILDALNGLVYSSDAQIAQVVARKTEQRAGFVMSNPPPGLASALGQYTDFVFIRIANGPDHQQVPV